MRRKTAEVLKKLQSLSLNTAGARRMLWSGVRAEDLYKEGFLAGRGQGVVKDSGGNANSGGSRSRRKGGGRVG